MHDIIIVEFKSTSNNVFRDTIYSYKPYSPFILDLFNLTYQLVNYSKNSRMCLTTLYNL